MSSGKQASREESHCPVSNKMIEKIKELGQLLNIKNEVHLTSYVFLLRHWCRAVSDIYPHFPLFWYVLLAVYKL